MHVFKLPATALISDSTLLHAAALQARVAAEAAATKAAHSAAPAHVPMLHSYDANRSLLVVAFLPPPSRKLLHGIAAGETFPLLADHLAGLLAALLAASSPAGMSPDAWRALTERFAANSDIVAANERVVFIDAFDSSCAANRWARPHSDAAVAALLADSAVWSAVEDMRLLYRAAADGGSYTGGSEPLLALIHNDLHAGNLLVTQSTTHLIDFEFATVGPAAYDLGSLIGNLLLAALTLPAGAPAAQRSWLLSTIESFWAQFDTLFWSTSGCGLQTALQRAALLPDALGFAACCMLRLTVGMHSYPALEAFASPAERSKRELAILSLAQCLLLKRRQLSMDQVTRLAKESMDGLHG